MRSTGAITPPALFGVLDEGLARPVGANVNVLPGKVPLEEEEKEVVDDDAEAKQLAGPYSAAVVALEAVDEGKVADAAAVVAARVEAVKGLLGDGSGDAVVDALGAEGHVCPRVHLLDLVVEAFGAHLAGADGGDGLAGGENEVVLLGLGEGGHVGGEDLGDTADLGTDHVQAATGRLDDYGPESLGEGGVEVDVAADHDVADVLVANGAEHLDAILQDVCLNHLFEVDGLWAGSSDDEARVGVVLEDAGDGGGEEVGALVVEEARDDDNGDDVVGSEAGGKRVRGEARGGGRGIVAGAEVFGDDGVGDDGDHERVEGGAQDRVFLAGRGGGLAGRPRDGRGSPRDGQGRVERTRYGSRRCCDRHRSG